MGPYGVKGMENKANCAPQTPPQRTRWPEGPSGMDFRHLFQVLSLPIARQPILGNACMFAAHALVLLRRDSCKAAAAAIGALPSMKGHVAARDLLPPSLPPVLGFYDDTPYPWVWASRGAR